MSIAENIDRVRTEIAAAARKAGRNPDEITLVGASKMNDAQACRAAIAAGIDALGENRVQEMLQKLDENAYDGVPLHFIGHLQRNKAKYVVGTVDLIQSVGSLALIHEIEKAAASKNIIQDILLEVNIAQETAKTGFAPSEIFHAAEAALQHPHLQVRGLMSIPPANTNRDVNMQYFDRIFTLYVDINEKMFHNKLKCISMGMSGDYTDAICAGATIVRVGTAIFGSRHYS